MKGEENLSLSILKGLLLKCFEETRLMATHLHVNSVKGYTKMTGRPTFLPIYSHEADICDPPQEFDAKGESTLTTRLHDTLSVP